MYMYIYYVYIYIYIMYIYILYIYIMYITHAYIRLSPFPCFVPLGSIDPSSPSSSPRGRLQEAHVKGRETLAAASKASLPRAVVFLGDWERGVFLGKKSDRKAWLKSKKLKVSDLIRFLRVEVETLPLILGCLLFSNSGTAVQYKFLGNTISIWIYHIYPRDLQDKFGFGSKCNTQGTTDFSLDLVLTCINHPFFGGYPILTQPWPWDRSRLLCKNRIDLQHLQCSKCLKKNCGKCWETNIFLGRFKSWTKDNDC